MNDRTTELLRFRPVLPNARITDGMSRDEHFQNATLRPIIKFQNALLVEVFRNYIHKHKSVFYGLTLPKKLEYIEHAIQKDMKFRNSLKGMVIGHFTVEEYDTYIQNSSALNKRMMNMVIERLKDQVQAFELAELPQ